MTGVIEQHYDIYLNTVSTDVIKAAQIVLNEEYGQLTNISFRYTNEYREHPHAFALDPKQLPLISDQAYFPCKKGVLSILDDYLPDAWGSKVINKNASYIGQHSLDGRSVIDILNCLSYSRIGALAITKPGANPKYDLGCEVHKINEIEMAALHIDNNSGIQSPAFDEDGLLSLVNYGTGIGGARPKALVHNEGVTYVAKFNKCYRDDFNHARVELAVLKMAAEAGLNVRDGHVYHGSNQHDVLLLDRFDVNNKCNFIYRSHLITINALLKCPDTQQDRGGIFRYDDIADILRQYSINTEFDLQQLLYRMLFNRAINNIDDHERNFSLINDGAGYCLSPAYDLVPSLSIGSYPVAGYGYRTHPPRPSEAYDIGKIFGLSKPTVRTICDQVMSGIERWEYWAERCCVSERDTEALKKVIKI